MIGHVGSKVSALIDGQLPAAESERLWAHVHCCTLCREHVEREGWIKTRLAGLGMPSEQPAAPNYLQSVLCSASSRADVAEAHAADPGARRRTFAVAVLGAGSVGAAMVGVLALALPTSAPPADRRAPTTSLTRNATPSPTAQPVGSNAPVGAAASARTPGPAASVPGWVRITQ